MRIGVQLGYAGGFKEAVEQVVGFERVGLDVVAVAEAYSFDAVSQLGYLAAGVGARGTAAARRQELPDPATR